MLNINLICRNNQDRIQDTLDSISAQTFEDFVVTVFDDASTDGTPDIIKRHCQSDARFAYTRNPNRLYVGNFQRAFQHGDHPFVMPKSSDDVIAPTFIEKCLARLQDPTVAMVHTRSDIIGTAELPNKYHEGSVLRLLEDNPLERAVYTAAYYTFAPSFWGIYRREQTAQLQPFQFINGFDHIILCELAMYGKIDYVDEVLFHRYKGGASMQENAKKATLQSVRDLELGEISADMRFFTPTISMIIGHMDMIRYARIPAAARGEYFINVIGVLRKRFTKYFENEIANITDRRDFFKQIANHDGLPVDFKNMIIANILHYIGQIKIVVGDTVDCSLLTALETDLRAG